VSITVAHPLRELVEARRGNGWTAWTPRRELVRPTFTPDGRRQLIDTGNRDFDRQTTCIGLPNLFGGTQIAIAIRAAGKRTSDGQRSLREWDLEHYPGTLPAEVVAEIHRHPEPLALHKFFHTRPDKEPVVHGYILSYGRERAYAEIARFVCGRDPDSERILDVVSQYCVTDPASGPAPIHRITAGS
jgi:hypothetical protein